jgi:uncharacterized membrane protein YeaQ/YmgE (transglycosylase-associated protein family)
MSTATILLGSIISILLGALFHLWRGGKAGRLLLYLILSIAGFWIGQWIANLLQWDFDKLGQLHIAFGILGGLLVLFLGYWLSLIDRRLPPD